MRVTQNDIVNFNNLYLKYKTYAEVARQTGFAASTVKKYIIKDYEPAQIENVKKFDRPLPDFNTDIFLIKDWSPLCTMSDSEFEEVKELWKELNI